MASIIPVALLLFSLVDARSPLHVGRRLAENLGLENEFRDQHEFTEQLLDFRNSETLVSQNANTSSM
jgi:hypothetical protein